MANRVAACSSTRSRTGAHALRRERRADRQLPGGGAEQDLSDMGRAARTAIATVLPLGVEMAALCLTGQLQGLVVEGERGAGSRDPASRWRAQRERA